MTQFNADTLTWGGVGNAAAVHINVTVTTTPTSDFSDLSQHPGFSVKPVWYCSNPNNLTPISFGLYIVSTPAGLADSLLSIAAKVASSPAGVLATLYIFPALVIIEKDMSINDVVQLAASQNGSVGLSVPLLLTPALYPLQLEAPVPPSVALDLSGCIGCVSLTGHARVYLTDLHLTGLQHPGPGPSSSSSSGSSGSATGDGSDLSLPLWSFQFNRSSSIPSVILYNVTLTLPQVPPPYTLHLAAGIATPCGHAPAPYTPQHCTPHTPNPTPRELLHPAPHNLHPNDCYTLHPTPYIP